MITIDRQSTTPVHEQLVEQMRYLIASGHFQVDERLPSTRVLADQIGISFHTVRKAYQQLEHEGRLTARTGSGYRVRERAPLSKGERVERGAVIVRDALHKLIGLGLHEGEVEHLFEEQFDLLSGEQQGRKLVFAAPYREMAEGCAEQIARGVQQTVEPVTFAELPRHQDADYVVARFADLRRVMEMLPRADALGVVTYLTPEALERIARLLPHQTLGLVTRYADAIQPLMTEIRTESGFDGQTLATSTDEGARNLNAFLDQADLLVYTPACRRRLLPLLGPDRRHAEIHPVVSREALDLLRQAIPS